MRTDRAGARAFLARLWTGRAAHLLGGGLDLAGAFARYGLARARARESVARSRGRARR